VSALAGIETTAPKIASAQSAVPRRKKGTSMTHL
jgi:hypothetical protein